MPDIPVLSIIGKSNSGKTTLLEKLIPELKQSGYRVATIKHHSHAGFEIDQPGKDTWRHAQAGSDLVIIAAPDKIATIRRLERALTLDEILAGIDGVDIVLTDGFKRGGKPALEVLRQASGAEMIGDPGQVLAIASDFPIETEIPRFDLDDVAGIVGWIEEHIIHHKN